MKFQILANFIVECTLTDNDQVEDNSPEDTQEPVWILHIDGASNAQDCDAGLILTNIDGMVIEYAFRFNFKASNKQAKYEALIVGFKIAKDFSVKCLWVFTNLQLIARQFRKEYAARDSISL